jgi:hypothetical protein
VGAGQPATSLNKPTRLFPLPVGGYVHFCTAKVNPVGIAKLLVIGNTGESVVQNYFAILKSPYVFGSFF